MKIEIDGDYLDWVLKNTPEGKKISNLPYREGEKMLTDYINEVLFEHRKSWENVEAFDS